MKKVLFVATVVKGHIDVFHIPYLKMFKGKGWETTVVARNNFEFKTDCNIPFCDNYINLPFERSPIKWNNYVTYVKLKKLIKENNYDIIHCHTPVGGAITRLATKKSKDIKVLYTAHGFHFFQGASKKNWLLFYPIEKYLLKYTDVLITMNDEDHSISSEKFNARKSVLVPGVGIDLDLFGKCSNEEKNQLREMYGYNKKQFILICVAELSNRKNQIQLLRVASLLKTKINQLKILIVGTGENEADLKKFVSFEKLGEIIEFLGYRTDVSGLMNLSDIVVSTSKQEGLPVNLLEGLAVGKPLIATNSRGNTDLAIDGVNGFVSNINDDKMMADNIYKLYNDKALYEFFSRNSLEMSRKYNIKKVLKIMEEIYFR